MIHDSIGKRILLMLIEHLKINNVLHSLTCTPMH